MGHVNTTLIRRFVRGKAKWEVFDQALTRKLGNIGKPKDARGTVQMAKELRRGIVEACKESMPVKGNAKIGAKWWTKYLTMGKRGVHRLRRAFQRLKKKKGSITEITVARSEYYKERRKYDQMIYCTRMESWKQFITEAGNNPWGYLQVELWKN